MRIEEKLKIFRDSTATSHRILAAVEAGLLSSAKSIALVARKAHPTFQNRTGRAEDSIQWQMSKDKNQVASEVFLSSNSAPSGWKKSPKYPYSAFLNDGTQRNGKQVIKAGNFIREAYIAKSNTIEKECSEAINKALKAIV